MTSRRRYPAALLLVLAAIALTTVFAASAAALPTFTQAVGGVGPCDSCHTQTTTHAVAAHQPLITGGQCNQCHTVNTSTPPTPTACAACHGGPSAILAAHAAVPAPGAGCATTPGCHGVPAADTVAPVITFTGVVNGKWYNSSKTIVFTATDNTGGSGVASITYAVNGGTPVVVMAATAEVMIEVDRATHANDGTYAVTYFATDVAGNSATTKTVTIKIDTRKPGTVAMANVKVVQNQTVRVAYKVTDMAPNAGKATVTIKIKTRSGKAVKTVKLGTQAVNKQLYAKIKANLKPGTYRYYIYAKDTAGNTQANVANKAFVVRRASTGGFNG